ADRGRGRISKDEARATPVETWLAEITAGRTDFCRAHHALNVPLEDACRLVLACPIGHQIRNPRTVSHLHGDRKIPLENRRGAEPELPGKTWCQGREQLLAEFRLRGVFRGRQKKHELEKLSGLERPFLAAFEANGPRRQGVGRGASTGGLGQRRRVWK